MLFGLQSPTVATAIIIIIANVEVVWLAILLPIQGFQRSILGQLAVLPD
jgi:hypothetical protein